MKQPGFCVEQSPGCFVFFAKNFHDKIGTEKSFMERMKARKIRVRRLSFFISTRHRDIIL